MRMMRFLPCQGLPVASMVGLNGWPRWCLLVSVDLCSPWHPSLCLSWEMEPLVAAVCLIFSTELGNLRVPPPAG